MDENRIAASVVESALEIHKELGPGLLESVYEVLLADSLIQRGLTVERQKSIAIPLSREAAKSVSPISDPLLTPLSEQTRPHLS